MLVLMYFSMGEMVGLPLPSYAAGMDGMFNLALTELILALPIVIINRKYYITASKRCCTVLRLWTRSSPSARVRRLCTAFTR